MVLLSMTLSDPLPRFEGHGVIFMLTDAWNVCKQLKYLNLYAIYQLVPFPMTLNEP